MCWPTRRSATSSSNKIKDAVTSFEPSDQGGKRIVNQRQFDRLTAIAGRDEGNHRLGGGSDASSLEIQPTVVVDPDLDEPLMRERDLRADPAGGDRPKPR